MQGETIDGAPVIAPFADARWAAYWLNAPRNLHKGQIFYRRMAETRFPDLLKLPSKYSWGHEPNHPIRNSFTRLSHGILNRVHRRFPALPVRSRLMDNYIDFHHAFRKREDYIAVLERTIAVLKQREATPWLDLDRLWNEHYRGRLDHAPTLLVLLGLAVNLEVNG